VTTTRYRTYAELHGYCRRSANPVGRLLLHLFGETRPAAVERSDAICTGLQLLNFCQDVALDWRKDRVYFPLDEMQAMHVSETHIERAVVDGAWQQLFALQLQRALGSLAAGAELPDMLRGRARLELRAIVAGGERIGALLRDTRGDVFHRRPVLGAADWLLIALRTARLLGAPARERAAPATPQ
jgi:phytoene/squalene synthetase